MSVTFKMTRKKWIFFIISTLVVYLVSWGSLYYSVMEFDVSHLFEYFYLSWTGGLEIIAYIQGGSLIIAFCYVGILSVLYFINSRMRAR